MSQKDESEVLDELFGDSDGEADVSMKIDEEIDENYTKETPKKPRGTRKKSSEDLNEEIEGSQEVDGNPIETL